MEPHIILRRERVGLPEWIREKPAFNENTRDLFFQSRVVFYPGAGSDGHAIKVFNLSDAAFCFVYANQGGCNYGQNPTGYRVVRDDQVLGQEFSQLLIPSERDVNFEGAKEWSARWIIFEREAGFGSDHGRQFFAVLYIQGEAFTTYWYLWARERMAPYAALIVDHGFGGNFTGRKFGGHESPMYLWAKENNAWPEWLLVSELGQTEPWPGYHRVSGGDQGGMHHDLRFLYRR